MNLIDKLKKDTNNASDMIYKKIELSNHTIYFIYNEVLTSGDAINDFILKNIAFLIDEEKKITDIYEFLYNSLPSHNVQKETEYQSVLTKLFNGFACFYYDGQMFSLELRATLDRGVVDAKSEIAIRGPKDAFNENFNKNLGLIRRRIKSEKLWIDTMDIGTLTKTKTGILYMQNIADLKKVKEVKNKLKAIDIDGILDSGYIKSMISHESKIFPTIQTTERPDLVAMALLEGKIVILVDTSPYALILPTFFLDFFHTPDDYYQKNVNISFIRVIRLLAFFISIFLPAYYISITTYNHDSISTNLLLNFMSQRQNVAFPALVEALLMTISFEILRESDTRMASTVGSAVSILGGLILGDALVSAGIISPIMIIVVATSATSGLVFTSVELSNAIRFYRILLMILASIFGIFGMYLGFIILITHLASINCLNMAYLSPISPLIPSEQKDSILRIANKNKKLRNPLLAKKNIVRGKGF